MALVFGLAACFATGYFGVNLAWPRLKAKWLVWLMKVPLWVGFGLGIFSGIFFLERFFGVTQIPLTDLLVTAAVFILYVLRRLRSRKVYSISVSMSDFKTSNWISCLVRASFVVSMLVALYAAVSRALSHPQGEGWDAFAIWNLHARFLFLGGSHWRDGFSALIPWSHPDYPLLVPAAVAHLWSYLGNDSPAIPAAIALIFAFATVGLLVSSLTTLRGASSAMLAGIAFVSTPFFIEQSASQYVDVALSFFILAAIVLFHLYHQLSSENEDLPTTGFLVLSGLAAGFAAWTKNEGLLFLFCFAAAQIVSGITERQSGKESPKGRMIVRTLILAILPVLALIAWFKHAIAPPGDLFTSSAAIAQKLLAPRRFWIVLQWYGKELLRFGNWWMVPGTVLLLAFYWLLPKTGVRPRSRALRSSALTLSLMLAGYFAVYVITPRDIYWHLRFSLNRLFLQLWPATIFLFFLFVGDQTQDNVSK